MTELRAANIRQLAKEYRRSMTESVLHSWAKDAADMLHAIAVVWEQEEADDAEIIRMVEERDGEKPIAMAIVPEDELNRLRAFAQGCAAAFNGAPLGDQAFAALALVDEWETKEVQEAIATRKTT